MVSKALVAKSKTLLASEGRRPKTPRVKRQPTEADLLMWQHLSELMAARVTGLCEIYKECKFCPDRKWRFDFAVYSYPLCLGIEIEGGAWSRGRHTRGAGFIADMEKYNFAALLGCHVLRFTPQQVLDGTAIAFIKRVLEA